MQPYLTLDTFLASQMVVLQADSNGQPVVQFAAEQEGLLSNGENINPFYTENPELTPAAFIVEVQPASEVKLTVLPINTTGEGFAQAAPIAWDATQQRYTMAGLIPPPNVPDGSTLPRHTPLPSETQAPDEMEIALYWAVGETLQPEYRRIPRTQAVGTAALELLLEGPQQPGLSTSIPTPQEVQSYPGRQPDWGNRVRLLDLTIENGVATANFSQEMQAYGGGSARVDMIRQQITQTLRQFPSVQEVRIAVEGEIETALQP
jgi:hypothetical protein